MSSNGSANGASPAAPTDNLPEILQDDPAAPAAWRHAWPRALETPGFDVVRHAIGLAQACLTWARYDRMRRAITEVEQYGDVGPLLGLLENAHREARIAAARMRLINDPSILGAPLDADGADVELRALFRG